jgi:hypothetical protein
MNTPDYLQYYFRTGQEPFSVLCDLDEHIAQGILKKDVLWRGDGTYLQHRKEHEKILRNKFIKKGGKPKRLFPIYAILGESPSGPHDLENEYNFKIKIPMRLFSNEDISFTYPDSLYEVPPDDIQRLHLKRNVEPTIYRFDEIEMVIERYKVYEIKNHYIEAQILNDENLKLYSNPKNWEKCQKRNGK